VSNPVPPSAGLLPSPQELRLRLAVALHEVDLLRRMIRLAERAAEIGQLFHTEENGGRREVSR
jgi:hypothetical protein